MINANENLSRVCRDFALPPWCGGLPHSKPQTPCIVVALLKEKNIRIPQKNILKLYVFWQMWLCPKFFGNIFVEFSTTLNVKTLMLEYAYPKRERERRRKKCLRSKKNQIVYGERNYCNCCYFRSILLLCLLKSWVCMSRWTWNLNRKKPSIFFHIQWPIFRLNLETGNFDFVYSIRHYFEIF